MDAFDHLRTTERSSPDTGNESVETLTNPKTTVDETNARTEKYVENIEHRVDELYQSLEKNTTSGWKSFNGFLTNFQKNIPEYVNQTRDTLDKLSLQEVSSDKSAEAPGGAKHAEYLELLKNSTNTYLDELDNDLQEVEKLVGGFASKFGSKFGSFLKDVITQDPAAAQAHDEDDADTPLDDQDAKVLFNVPDSKSKVFGTRLEQRLYELDNSKELYLGAVQNQESFEAYKKAYSAPDETSTEKILKSNTDLGKLYTQLVPSALTSDDFWLRYHYHKSLIENEESTKKKLLSSGKNTGGEEDKFDWDDDEEEEAEKATPTEDAPATGKSESRTSSEVTYNLESANSSTLDVVSSKRQPDSSNNEAGDDDDDDWE